MCALFPITITFLRSDTNMCEDMVGGVLFKFSFCVWIVDLDLTYNKVHMAAPCSVVVETSTILWTSCSSGASFCIFKARCTVARVRLWATAAPSTATLGALRPVVRETARRRVPHVLRDAGTLGWYWADSVHVAPRLVRAVNIRPVPDVAIPFVIVAATDCDTGWVATILGPTNESVAVAARALVVWDAQRLFPRMRRWAGERGG